MIARSMNDFERIFSVKIGTSPLVCFLFREIANLNLNCIYFLRYLTEENTSWGSFFSGSDFGKILQEQIFVLEL